MVKRNIPYNTAYRPQGIYDNTEKLKDIGCEYFVIYPDYLTSLPIKKDFFKKVSSYVIYDRYEEKDDDTVNFFYKYNYGILKIPNGRIYSNNIDYISIITSDNQLVDKFSYQYHRDRFAPSKENKILTQKYFSKPEKIDGTVFSMLAGSGATGNIGHWFIDSIPRIHLLKRSGLFDEVDYFLVPAYKYDYHIDSLKLAGIEKEKIIVAKEDLHIEAKNLIVSNHPRGDRSYLLPDWITNALREEYLTPDLKDKSSPTKIFISRKDSSYRQIVQEDTIVDKIEKYGYESVQMSKYSFIEKVKLFCNADSIVSASGAGLTCLFFANKNARLIEMFPEGFVDTHFYNIAYHLGLDYLPIICKSDNPSQDMFSGQREDISVEVDFLVDKIVQSESLKSH